MAILLLTLAFFGFAVAIMAVGVMFKRPCLRGSCGGAEVLDAKGDSLACSTCPKRKERLAKLARLEAEGAGSGNPRLPVL